MKALGVSPRSEYQDHLKSLGGNCAFCPVASGCLIAEYEKWLWIYSAFPYRKYHTLLVPKRHLILFQQLSDDELLEMKKIVAEIERTYFSSGIIGASSDCGDQIFFCWRSRFDPSIKMPVAHLHLHIYPKSGGADDVLLDPTSHEIDKSKLVLAKELKNVIL